LDTVLSIVDELADIECRKVIVTGGEPLVRNDLETIVAACIRQGSIADLNSNLLLMTPSRASSLAAAGLTEASTSVYGPPAVHDRFVQCPGALTKTLEGIRALRQQGITVDVHCALGNFNAEHIETVVAICQQADCASVTFFTLLRTARPQADQKSWQIDGPVLPRLDAARAETSLPIASIGLAPLDLTECQMGRGIVGISADLRLKPCLLAQRTVGGEYPSAATGLRAALSQMRRRVANGWYEPACCDLPQAAR
jgi:MoaA/NifB/PqqE/SkfB family radical SAM enzyme